MSGLSLFNAPALLAGTPTSRSDLFGGASAALISFSDSTEYPASLAASTRSSSTFIFALAPRSVIVSAFAPSQ